MIQFVRLPQGSTYIETDCLNSKCDSHQALSSNQSRIQTSQKKKELGVVAYGVCGHFEELVHMRVKLPKTIAIYFCAFR